MFKVWEEVGFDLRAVSPYTMQNGMYLWHFKVDDDNNMVPYVDWVGNNGTNDGTGTGKAVLYVNPEITGLLRHFSNPNMPWTFSQYKELESFIQNIAWTNETLVPYVETFTGKEAIRETDINGIIKNGNNYYQRTITDNNLISFVISESNLIDSLPDNGVSRVLFDDMFEFAMVTGVIRTVTVTTTLI